MSRLKLSIAGALAIIVALLLATGSPAARQSRLSAWLDTAVRQARPTERLAVWVYFTDKDGAATASASPVTARARQRRSSRGTPSAATAFEDRALSPVYVQRVTGLVERVRQQSRWLNAVSVEVTPARNRPAVDAHVRGAAGRRAPLSPPAGGTRRTAGRSRAIARLRGHDVVDEPLDYGTGLDQVRQLRVPDLHERGLHGEGVVIAVFDSGFPNLGHEAFASMTIVAERDFVEGRESVRDSTDAHGTNTLSALGGYAPGQLIGPAYRAAFILAVTEDVRSETPVEEDQLGRGGGMGRGARRRRDQLVARLSRFRPAPIRPTPPRT